MKNHNILFKTQDGYDITLSDKYYSVKVKELLVHPSLKHAPIWSIAGPYNSGIVPKQTGDILYFRSRSNAEDYIALCKPR
jgi:hypothetical protein